MLRLVANKPGSSAAASAHNAVRSTGWRHAVDSCRTASCHHLAYHGGQDGVGVLPADQVEALEGLVCEIKRVSPTGECAVRVGGKQEVGERNW